MNYKAIVCGLVMTTAALGNVECDDCGASAFNFDNDMRCIFGVSHKDVCFQEAQQGTLTGEMVASLDEQDRVALLQDINNAVQTLQEKVMTPSQERLARIGSWVGGLGAVAGWGVFMYNTVWGSVYMNEYLGATVRADICNQELTNWAENYSLFEKAKNIYLPIVCVDGKILNGMVAEKTKWQGMKYAGTAAASYVGFAVALVGYAACKVRLNTNEVVKAELQNLQKSLEVVVGGFPCIDGNCQRLIFTPEELETLDC